MKSHIPTLVQFDKDEQKFHHLILHVVFFFKVFQELPHNIMSLNYSAWFFLEINLRDFTFNVMNSSSMEEKRQTCAYKPAKNVFFFGYLIERYGHYSNDPLR